MLPIPSFVARLKADPVRILSVVLLVLIGVIAGVAQAQNVDIDDPPGRVGKISLLDGRATLMDLRDGSGADAELNWPITSGMRLSTQGPARAEVRIGSTAIRLDADTVVDFVRVDDDFVQIALLQGSASLRLRNRDLLDEIEVVTQREKIVFDETGRYRIDVDLTPGVTAVSAFSGGARVLSGRSTFAVRQGERGEVTAPPAATFVVDRTAWDGFDAWVATRDRRDDELLAARYVSREMTGIESLDQYGRWRAIDGYGSVWFPSSVDAGWAPYRYGRWAYVAPWGWTWIDEAPWGFAPFHYGRWAFIGGVWGWVPGAYVARPVYAPALVAWYGAPGVNIHIGGGDRVGWFPLGPGEVYVPHYRHSPRHRDRINIHHVRDGNRVTQVREPSYVYRDPRFSTWVARDRFDKDAAHRARRDPPSEWRRFVGSPHPPENIPGTKRRQADADFRGGRSRAPAESAPTPVPQVAPPAAAQIPPPARSPGVRSWSSAPAADAPPRRDAPPIERTPRRVEPSRSSDAVRDERFSRQPHVPRHGPDAPAVQSAPPPRATVTPPRASEPPSPSRAIGRGSDANDSAQGRSNERGGPPQFGGPQSRARER